MERKLFFENKKGDRLCGILSDPKPEDLHKPLIILVHGFSTCKDSNKNVTLQKLLNGKGVATFRFDLYGHGESQGKIEDITVSEAANDILCCIGFLINVGYSRFGLVGSSFGGTASILAAAESACLFALALVCPVSDYLEKEKLQRGSQGIKKWKQLGLLPSPPRSVYRPAPLHSPIFP